MMTKRKLLLERAEPLNKHEIINILSNSGFYMRYLHGIWGYNEADKNIRKLLADIYITGNQRIGLYVYGPIGAGKSTLLGNIAKSLIKRFYVNIKYTTTANLINTIYRFQDYELLEEYRTVTILFLDDFGWEYDSEYGIVQFIELLKYRYGRELPTFIASNSKLEEIISRSNDPKRKMEYQQMVSLLNDEHWIHEIMFNFKDQRINNQLNPNMN